MSPDELAVRIRGEYREMPGLQLTFAQARILWDLDAATCSAVLQILVDEGFLIGRSDGRFVALPAESMHSRAGTADLPPKQLRQSA